MQKTKIKQTKRLKFLFSWNLFPHLRWLWFLSLNLFTREALFIEWHVWGHLYFLILVDTKPWWQQVWEHIPAFNPIRIIPRMLNRDGGEKVAKLFTREDSACPGRDTLFSFLERGLNDQGQTLSFLSLTLRLCGRQLWVCVLEWMVACLLSPRF